MPGELGCRDGRAAWLEPFEEQHELPAAIGLVKDPEPVATRAAVTVTMAERRSQAERFRQGLAALAQYVGCVGRVGNAKVPHGHKEVLEAAAARGAEVGASGALEEPVTVALGVWVDNAKARRDKLNPEQPSALQELGVALQARWRCRVVSGSPGEALGVLGRRGVCAPGTTLDPSRIGTPWMTSECRCRCRPMVDGRTGVPVVVGEALPVNADDLEVLSDQVGG